MYSATVSDSSVGLLEEILNSHAENPMTGETARYFLGLTFPARATARTNELLAKNRTDTGLTQEESDEIDHLIHMNYLLAALHSRARRVLAKAS